MDTSGNSLPSPSCPDGKKRERYAGGSLAAARALGSGKADIAINWSGGMHHACEAEASGFCFVNDIVLAIRRSSSTYVDIDVHHGDGVETAFLDSNQTAVAIGKEIDDNIPVHCYDTYYSSQGYKLHYPVDKRRENKNSKTYIQRTMSAVKQNLSHLEAAPSVQFQDPPGPGGSGSIDTEPLFYEQAPREDDDPMERLHRLCGERRSAASSESWARSDR
ncbi:unnamed protein product [Miscanthus lutarioriparius]|uniref:Histone deacetylase domain-containing protein n=1 Tax=Miscanthus lutarioriparius TaxID=422564 RepID=A0A811P0K4_9POAL|nr:unnamed protein product [Miscanthus lutarioriparius]